MTSPTASNAGRSFGGRTLFGAAAGLTVALGALLAARLDWVFVYLLGAPYYFATVAHDPGGTPWWVSYPVTCAYFAILGGVLGTLCRLRPGPRYLAVAMVLTGHLWLAVVGAQHVLRDTFDALRGAQLPAPEAWPQDGSAPRSSPTTSPKE